MALQDITQKLLEQSNKIDQKVGKATEMNLLEIKKTLAQQEKYALTRNNQLRNVETGQFVGFHEMIDEMQNLGHNFETLREEAKKRNLREGKATMKFHMAFQESIVRSARMTKSIINGITRTFTKGFDLVSKGLDAIRANSFLSFLAKLGGIILFLKLFGRQIFEQLRKLPAFRQLETFVKSFGTVLKEKLGEAFGIRPGESLGQAIGRGLGGFLKTTFFGKEGDTLMQRLTRFLSAATVTLGLLAVNPFGRDFLRAVGGVGKLFGSIFTSIKSFLVVSGSLSNAFMGLVRIAFPISLLFGVIGGILNSFKTFREGDFFGGVADFIEGGLKTVFLSLSKAIGGLGSTVLGFLGLDRLAEVFKGLATVIGQVIDVVVAPFRFLGALFSGDKDLAKDTVKKLFSNLGNILKFTLKTVLASLGTVLIDLPKILFKGLIAVFIKLPLLILKGLTNAIGTLFGLIKDAILGLPGFLKDKVIGSVVSFFKGIVNFFKKLPGAALAGIKALAPGGKSPGEAFMEALREGNEGDEEDPKKADTAATSSDSTVPGQAPSLQNTIITGLLTKRRTEEQEEEEKEGFFGKITKGIGGFFKKSVSGVESLAKKGLNALTSAGDAGSALRAAERADLQGLADKQRALLDRRSIIESGRDPETGRLLFQREKSRMLRDVNTQLQDNRKEFEGRYAKLLAEEGQIRKDQLSELKDKLLTPLRNTAGFAREKFADVKEGAGQFFTQLKDNFTQAFPGVSEKVGTLFTGIKDTFTQAFPGVSEKVGTLFTKLKDTFTGIKDTALAKVNNVKDAVTGMVDNVKDKFITLKNDKDLLAFATNLKDSVKGFFSRMKDNIVGVKDKVVGMYTKLNEATWTDVGNGIKKMAKIGLDKTKQFTEGLKSEVEQRRPTRNRDFLSPTNANEQGAMLAASSNMMNAGKGSTKIQVVQPQSSRADSTNVSIYNNVFNNNNHPEPVFMA